MGMSMEGTDGHQEFVTVMGEGQEGDNNNARPVVHERRGRVATRSTTADVWLADPSLSSSLSSRSSLSVPPRLEEPQDGTKPPNRRQ